MSTISEWLTLPAQAHAQWRKGLVLAEREYAQQSQRLYMSLFGRFCAWLSTKPYNLQTLDQEDLMRFLQTLQGRGGQPAANRTQRTYIAEIDRVLAHLKGMGVRADNPARDLLETLRITTPLRPRSITILREDTRALYVQSLHGLEPITMAPEAIQTAAMNFLMLDCGLTLKELQKMVLRHLAEVAQGQVFAPGHRLLLPRSLPLTPEAQHWLQAWLAVRTQLHVVTPGQYKIMQGQVMVRAGQLKAKKPGRADLLAQRSGRGKVFVSFTGQSGKAHGLRGTGLVVDHLPESTIYLGAQAVLQAGRQMSRAERQAMRHKGPQALRNRYCATKVAQGLPTGEIVAFMGLHRADQVWAMSRAMKL